MRALVKQKRGEGFVDLVETKEPKPEDGEFLIRVGYAGICGSDLNILHDRFPNYVVPVTLGHEFAGTVEESGPNSTGFSKGERVACETHAYVCNECLYCRTGLYNLCYQRKAFGYGVDGAFAKHVRVRSTILHKLPDEISMEEAALLEPLSVALNALTRNSKIETGDSVVVLGPGPIGLMCALVARHSGAEVTVVGTETSAQRVALVGKMGIATMTGQELHEQIGKWEGGGGFDVAVIAAGRAPVFETALLAARRNGRVVHLGESTEKATFQLSLIERKNLTINGSFSHNWPVWEQAISLIRDGLIDVKPLITHKFALDEWKSAFDVVEGRAGMKVLLRP